MYIRDRHYVAQPVTAAFCRAAVSHVLLLCAEITIPKLLQVPATLLRGDGKVQRIIKDEHCQLPVILRSSTNKYSPCRQDSDARGWMLGPEVPLGFAHPAPRLLVQANTDQVRSWWWLPLVMGLLSDLLLLPPYFIVTDIIAVRVPKCSLQISVISQALGSTLALMGAT